MFFIDYNDKKKAADLIAEGNKKVLDDLILLRSVSISIEDEVAACLVSDSLYILGVKASLILIIFFLFLVAKIENMNVFFCDMNEFFV